MVTGLKFYELPPAKAGCFDDERALDSGLLAIAAALGPPPRPEMPRRAAAPAPGEPPDVRAPGRASPGRGTGPIAFSFPGFGVLSH